MGAMGGGWMPGDRDVLLWISLNSSNIDQIAVPLFPRCRNYVVTFILLKIKV